MAIYISTKTYTPTEQFSCCFRQWRAGNSRSNLLHGYALSFKLVFECHHLDDNSWAIDLSSLDNIKTWLKTQFDHTTIIAEDDPELDAFKELNDKGVCDLRVLPGTSCEKFAEHVFRYARQWMEDQGLLTRVTIRSVECSEHEGNTAMYIE